MPYQLSHKHFGLFQGLHSGALYWLNYSMSPFFGIHPFSSTGEIGNFLSTLVLAGFVEGDFVVELFDEELNEKLKTHSGHFVLPGNC